MNILLTAFEPFGTSTTNITQEVIKTLPEQIGEYLLHKLVLPVSFQRAPKVLCEAIERVKPDFVVMLGQCKDSDSIRLERYAHNLMDSHMGDNDGYCPKEEVIHPDAPTALTANTPYPLHEYLDKCTTAELPVTISSSAGLYVCNRVYYEALFQNAKALFIHIPKNMDIHIAEKSILQILK